MNKKKEIRKELNEYLDKYIPRTEVDIYKYVVDFIKKDRKKQLILNGVGCTCCDKTRKHNDLLKDEFKDDYCNWCDRKIV